MDRGGGGERIIMYSRTHRKEKNMIRRISILSLVGLLMVLMSSCKAAPTVTIPMPTPTPTASARVQTGSSEEAKISVQYPEGWIAERTILEGLNAMIFRETVEEDAPELTVLSAAAEGQDADHSYRR